MSVSDKKKGQSITEDREVGRQRGFKIKGWTMSRNLDNQDEMAIPNESYAPTKKVLGIGWRPSQIKLQRKKEEVLVLGHKWAEHSRLAQTR